MFEFYEGRTDKAISENIRDFAEVMIREFQDKSDNYLNEQIINNYDFNIHEALDVSNQMAKIMKALLKMKEIGNR